MKSWRQFVKWTTVYWPRSVDLPSSAIILLVRSAKVVVGLAFRSCRTCTALEDTLASLLDRTCLSSSEISLSSLSTKDSRLCMDLSDTNSTKMQESILTIATKYTNERNRFKLKHFADFRSLLISCSIWVKVKFKILSLSQVAKWLSARRHGMWTFCVSCRYISRDITINIMIDVACKMALTSLFPW